MWMIDCRALWLSTLWVWGKAGLIVWSGPAIQPSMHHPVKIARVKKGRESWWKGEGRGNIAAKDTRIIKPRIRRLRRRIHASLSKKKLFSQKKYNKGVFRLHFPIPHARMGSRYGWRVSPIRGKMIFHRGIDFGASYGTKVYAAADGIIWRSGWMGSCGLGIVIVHRSGISSCYCHLSQILASYRSHVRQGELIGKVGSTGSSTAPHLHFSVLKNRKFVNPLLFLKR